MKKKYKSDLLESLHETAVGLHTIKVINDKEMQEYDRDCLISEPKNPSESTGVQVKPPPVYASKKG